MWTNIVNIHNNIEDYLQRSMSLNQTETSLTTDSGFCSNYSLNQQTISSVYDTSSNLSNFKQESPSSSSYLSKSPINLSKQKRRGFLIRDIISDDESDGNASKDRNFSVNSEETLERFGLLYKKFIENMKEEEPWTSSDVYEASDLTDTTSIQTSNEFPQETNQSSLDPCKTAEILTLIGTDDPRLVYVNDGMAIKNPFALERRTQVEVLAKRYCEKIEIGYLCKACLRITESMRQMNQHLLAHSDQKFYLCVTCLKGFNDKYDMKRHTRKHTSVKPFKCHVCNKGFSQRCSLEGHQRKIHKLELNYAKNERRKSLKVCEKCGYTADNLSSLNYHISQSHQMTLEF